MYSCTFDGTYGSVVAATPTTATTNASVYAAARTSSARALSAEHRRQLSAVGGFLSPGCVARLAASMSAPEADEYLRVVARLVERVPLDDAPVEEQLEFCCRLKMDAWPIETRLLRTPPDAAAALRRTDNAMQQRLTPPQRAEKRNAARRLRRAELRMRANNGGDSSSSMVSETAASVDDRDVVAAAMDLESEATF